MKKTLILGTLLVSLTAGAAWAASDKAQAMLFCWDQAGKARKEVKQLTSEQLAQLKGICADYMFLRGESLKEQKIPAQDSLPYDYDLQLDPRW